MACCSYHGPWKPLCCIGSYLRHQQANVIKQSNVVMRSVWNSDKTFLFSLGRVAFIFNVSMFMKNAVEGSVATMGKE